MQIQTHRFYSVLQGKSRHVASTKTYLLDDIATKKMTQQLADLINIWIDYPHAETSNIKDKWRQAGLIPGGDELAPLHSDLDRTPMAIAQTLISLYEDNVYANSRPPKIMQQELDLFEQITGPVMKSKAYNAQAKKNSSLLIKVIILKRKLEHSLVKPKLALKLIGQLEKAVQRDLTSYKLFRGRQPIKDTYGTHNVFETCTSVLSELRPLAEGMKSNRVTSLFGNRSRKH